MIPLIFLFGAQDTYQNYSNAVEAAGGRVRFSADPREAGGCSGLLVPGGGDLDPRLYGEKNAGSLSPDPVRDEAELALIRSFADARLPILGICRGEQLINAAFGGTLIQDLPGHSRVDGTDRLHRVDAAPRSEICALYGANFIVNSAHHQAAGRIGTGLRITARAKDGVVEALEHETLPVLGIQWHPERLTGTLKRQGAADGGRLFSLFLSRCSSQVL